MSCAVMSHAEFLVATSDDRREAELKLVLERARPALTEWFLNWDCGPDDVKRLLIVNLLEMVDWAAIFAKEEIGDRQVGTTDSGEFEVQAALAGLHV